MAVDAGNRGSRAARRKRHSLECSKSLATPQLDATLHANTLARIESAIEGVERNTRQPGNGRAESAVRYSERH
jgi:hypothetical protein